METGQRHKDLNTRREFERLQKKPSSNGDTQRAVIDSQGSTGIVNPSTGKVRAENIGTGHPVLVEGGIRPLYEFKTLIAGDNVEIESTDEEVVISSVGMGGSLPPGTINQTLRHTGAGVSTYEATSRLQVLQYTPLIGGGVHGVLIGAPSGETAYALQILTDGGGFECFSGTGSTIDTSSSISTTTLRVIQSHSSAASVAFNATNYSENFQAYAIDARAYKRAMNVQTMFLNTLNENTYAGYFVNSSGLNTGYRGVAIYGTATGIRKRAAQFDLSTADTTNTVVEINTPNATKGVVINAPGSPRSVATGNAALSVVCTDSTHLGISVEGYIHSFGAINSNTSFTVLDTTVVSQRQTGWSAPTGTSTRTTFNTATVSLSGLAERVKAIIDDLMTHGLIGN